MPQPQVEFRTCLACNKSWPAQVFNDAGICWRCRAPVLIMPPNPIFEHPDAQADRRRIEATFAC